MNTDAATLTSSATDENAPRKNGKAKQTRAVVNQERAGVFNAVARID
ncbi:MAG: hypothetical protein ACREFE_04775 [Limisphaerales bacterium]